MVFAGGEKTTATTLRSDGRRWRNAQGRRADADACGALRNDRPARLRGAGCLNCADDCSGRDATEIIQEVDEAVALQISATVEVLWVLLDPELRGKPV